MRQYYWLEGRDTFLVFIRNARTILPSGVLAHRSTLTSRKDVWDTALCMLNGKQSSRFWQDFYILKHLEIFGVLAF